MECDWKGSRDRMSKRVLVMLCIACLMVFGSTFFSTYYNSAKRSLDAQAAGPVNIGTVHPVRHVQRCTDIVACDS